MEQVILLVFLSCLLTTVPSAGHSVHHSEKIRQGIIGGDEAKPHSRPYMASLTSSDSGGHFCGGSLITPEWVLSAAHCHNSDTTIVLGAHDVSQPEQTQQILGVQSYHVHAEYDNEVMSNDIMLLKLSSRAQINHYVQTVPLPTSQNDLPQNTPCSVAGWGLIDKMHDTDKLFEVNVTIVSRRLCRRFFPILDEGMICAGNIHKLRDSSQGDSGGPLICGGTVEGVVSYGFDHPPGVYSRVANYLEWISKTISEHNDMDN
ncbi:duodenase-1-like isoform X2 [Pseudophryne corroboree]|uniref:duodenase-1-like isoform X2 n=1 Tax=Pseudophryne corroboree TaxID=495146 RepID=UPI0030820CBC